MSLFIKIIIIIMLLDPKNIVFGVLLVILMILEFFRLPEIIHLFHV